MSDPFIGSTSDSLVTATTVNHIASAPRFRRLKHVLIRLSSFGQGPVLAGATIESKDQTIDSLILASREWIRTGNSASATPDVWAVAGDWPLPDNQNLVLFLRNDSGATVNWQANWLVE